MTKMQVKSALLVRVEWDQATELFLEAGRAWGRHLDALEAGQPSPFDGVALRAELTNRAAVFARADALMRELRARERAAGSQGASA